MLVAVLSAVLGQVVRTIDEASGQYAIKLELASKKGRRPLQNTKLTS